MSQIIQKYLSAMQTVYSSGKATEHSYRPALQDFFKELTGYKVTNEPSRSEHGAPDFIFMDNMFPVCYAEHKDINISLDKIEKSEQLSRYFGYAKLILTNGLEFRFYNNGTRYGEPIILAELKGASLEIFNDRFEYFIKSFNDFLHTYIDTIRNAEDLSKIMGGRARRIRDNIKAMLASSDEKTYTEIKQMKRVFKELLIHDLDDTKFADLYAQTLVYGLFVARYNDKTPKDFSRREAIDLVPESNPLLRKFFDHIAGSGFEKRLGYIVDELCEVFRHCDVHALMHGLYQKKDIETHDPVIHFYEDFLKEYDSKLRLERGVFYTPMPVVQFMVRAIDELLKSKFDLGRGLLDTSKIDVDFDSQLRTEGGKIKKATKKVHRVQLLDPATGTGTFLNEVIKFIHNKMSGQQGLWKEYVNSDLLPRLHGFELMMASYTIAHLKLGLTLSETGVDEIKQRLKVYLTNSLEEGVKVQNDLLSFFDLRGSITEEAREAGHIKTEEPIMIVLGNPPYSGVSTNTGDWITAKIEDYKYVDGVHFGERKHWLQDDYVKFFRLSESLIEKKGEGILAFITNHGYIDNPTFRGMRWHLLQTFDEIYIVDLHGNSKKKETAEDGTVDQNVFDIQQGVSIFLGVKTGKKKKGELGKVYHSDIYGKRDIKYNWLTENTIASISWKEVTLDKKYYFFCPKDFYLQAGYSIGFGVQELFSLNVTGIVTMGDSFMITDSKDEIEKRIKELLENRISKSEFDEKYSLGKNYSNWIFNNKKDLEVGEFDVRKIVPIVYRPFDIKYIYFDDKFIWRSRSKVTKHIINFDNLGLITARSNKSNDMNHFFVSKFMSEAKTGESTTQSMHFPLYIYSESGTFETGEGEVQILKTPNLDASIWKKINKVVGETSPEDILDYIYAILHSKTYRETYKEFLKIDFPKIPYPKDKENFFSLVELGREIRSFHLLENPKVWEFMTSYPIEGDNLIEKVKFQDDKVFINNTQYFSGISKDVFEFQIGGYKPAEKYLKDRKGRNLNSEEFENYQKMIVALSETIRIMDEIDKVFKI